jgi:hypothetical protein
MTLNPETMEEFDSRYSPMAVAVSSGFFRLIFVSGKQTNV